ncbi:ABC transporter permease [Agrobacterium vitis]
MNAILSTRFVKDSRTRALILPGAILMVILLAAVLAPILPLSDPTKMNVAQRFSSPTATYWLGTDEFGRDILSRLIWGARATLAVALSSSIIACVAGVSLALIGGYLGELAETVTVRLTDIILSFPTILLALLAVTILGPSLWTLIFVLSILNTPGFTRVAYGEVLALRTAEFVEAAQVLGLRTPRILLGTILPNIMAPILVQFSLTVASAIVVESGLSFLGLGVVPPTPSWGTMIRGARAALDFNVLVLVWPCLALIISIFTLNWLCDGLRDALDIRSRKTGDAE